jgi:hypothetical protein
MGLHSREEQVNFWKTRVIAARWVVDFVLVSQCWAVEIGLLSSEEKELGLELPGRQIAKEL